MSYLNHAHDPRRRVTALVTVGAVHALLAVGLITGLTVTFDRLDPGRLIGTTVPLDPPKPDPTPTPTAEPVPTTYLPTAPIPPIPLPSNADPVPPASNTDETRVTYFPTGPIDPPAPPLPPPTPSFAPKRATPSNDSARWITTNDYPRRAIVDEVEGSVGYRLVVGTAGRVASCELTRPSGNRALDDATCRLLTSRARFEPASDETGAKVLGTFTGTVRWELPD